MNSHSAIWRYIARPLLVLAFVAIIVWIVIMLVAFV